MSELYESNIVGGFMYRWGYADARTGKTNTPGLLQNAQNPLDNLIGDVFGAVRAGNARDRRCFIIEFKRELTGFADEVHGSMAKPHRNALYHHFRTDKKCREMAKFGHIAAFFDEKEIITHEYANAVGPAPNTQLSSVIHDLDYRSWTLDFDKLYDALNETNVTRFGMNPLFYNDGLGLPLNTMERYLRCMVQFSLPLPTTPTIVEKESKNLIFGVVTPGAKAALAIGSYNGLLLACARFASMAAPKPPVNKGP